MCGIIQKQMKQLSKENVLIISLIIISSITVIIYIISPIKYCNYWV